MKTCSGSCWCNQSLSELLLQHCEGASSPRGPVRFSLEWKRMCLTTPTPSETSSPSFSSRLLLVEQQQEGEKRSSVFCSSGCLSLFWGLFWVCGSVYRNRTLLYHTILGQILGLPTDLIDGVMTHSQQHADGRVWTDGGTHTKQKSGREFLLFFHVFQWQPVTHSRKQACQQGV